MKYAKHGVTILFLLVLFVFGIEGLSIYLTGVFNGDVSFLYFMYLILYSLLLIAILFWLKKQKIDFRSNKQKWKWSYLRYFALVILWFFFWEMGAANVSRFACSCCSSNQIANLYLSKWPRYFVYSVFCPSNHYISYDRRIHF